MKLRFRENSLRVRLNQSEVRTLASGTPLRHELRFPAGERFAYTVAPSSDSDVSFRDGEIYIRVPRPAISSWAASEEIGIYFGDGMRVAVEKDLVCVDGPPEERDEDAFPRSQNC